MKKLIPFLILIFCINTQSQSLDKKQLSELFTTYGFCYGQEAQIDHIQKSFPKLEYEILQAKSEFAVTFGESCKFLRSLIPKDLQTKMEMTFAEKVPDFLTKNRNRGPARFFYYY